MDGSFEDIDASDGSVSGGGSAASDTETAPPGDDGQDEHPHTDDAGEFNPRSQAADFVLAESLVMGTSPGRATPHHWLRGMREVGREAVWSLSGAKPGNGVSYLLDDNTDSYWQSDGAQPHTITVQFHRRTEVSAIALFLNHTADESYTPEVISIRAGTTFHDLREIQHLRLSEPEGWVITRLEEREPRKPMLDGSLGSLPVPFLHSTTTAALPVRCTLLQVVVLAMHQKGRDTHVRQMKVFSPRQSEAERRGRIGLGMLGGAGAAKAQRHRAMRSAHAPAAAPPVSHLSSAGSQRPKFQTTAMLGFNFVR